MVRRACSERTHAVPHVVERTCVGCRKRSAASELLRIVAVPRVTGDGELTGVFDLVPDLARRMPGRGAHLHHDPACFALAIRRRAFGRALRIAGGIDSEKLEQHYALHAGGGAQTSPAANQPGRTTHMSTR